MPWCGRVRPRRTRRSGGRAGRRSAGSRRPRCRARGLATPEEPEALSVPAQDRLGLSEARGVVPGRGETGEEHEHPSIRSGEAWARDLPEGDRELLAQGRVLAHQVLRRAEPVQDVAKDGSGRRARPPVDALAKRGNHRGHAGRQGVVHLGVLGRSRTRVNRPVARRNPRSAEPDGSSSKHEVPPGA